MTIAAIDFCRLYSDHMAAAAGKAKSERAWDTRAADMSKKAVKGNYADDFIARMDLSDASTLLDVGCGPGTICLPLASRLERVTGLDYSRAMLDALRENAAAQGNTNVDTIHLAWEDDWSAVPECDIVVASRSTTVEDIGAALKKLHTKARKRIYLTHLVGGRFIDPRIFEAIGRKQLPLPDYIYLLNILHSWDIHPRVDYIEVEGRLAGVTDFDELARRVAWTLGDFSEDERTRLHAWFESVAPCGGADASMRWALISWEK